MLDTVLDYSVIFWRKEEGTCFILIPEIAESFVIDSDEKGDSVQ